jgi:hypothetical protein
MQVRQYVNLKAPIEVLAVFAGALALNAKLVHHPPRYDELYHVLAGTSWAADGTFSIAEGEYTRANLFTQLVGLLFRHFGTDVDLARLISVVSSAMLVVSVFAWTRARVGRPEAWVASGLLALSTTNLTLATMVRFYSLHALLFFLGAICVYAVVESSHRRSIPNVARTAALVLIFPLCFHLQLTTLIGLAALALWIIIRLLPTLRVFMASRSPVGLILMATGGVAILAAASILLSEVLGELWSSYTFQALWAQDSSALTYHWWLQRTYPVFYGLLPGVILISLMHHPRPAAFCSVVFFSSLAVHSFGGMRGEHYVFYLLPFFVIICSMATVPTLYLLRDLARQSARHNCVYPLTVRAQGISGTAMIVISLIFLFAATPGIYRSVKVLADGPAGLHPQYSVNWLAAREGVERAAATSDVIVTTNSLSALYAQIDYDVEISATILQETDTGVEFDRDRRTGRPVISALASIELLKSCYRTGLVVAERWQWGNRLYGVNEEIRSLLESSAERIDLPARSGLIAYRWENPAATIDRECPDLSRRRDASHVPQS